MSEILTYNTKNNEENMAVKELMENPFLKDVVISVSVLPDIKNYIMVEVTDKDYFTNNCKGNKYIRGMVKGKIKIEEITKHMDVLKDFEIGEKVTVLGGALKGSKGKIVGVDKKEVTIILDDSAVVIPIRIDKGSLRKEGSSQEHKNSNIVENTFDGSAKQMGFMKKTPCLKCGHELEYLYIPSHQSKEVQASTGNRIFMCTINAKIIGEDECPECQSKTYNTFKKAEEGCRILRSRA